jgi:ATP-dependent exoDNAse (exonuclease V) alpha subunit
MYLKKNKKIFKGYTEKKLKPIVEKYKENIWFIENIENIKNDKSINDEFKTSMAQYISSKLHNCDLKTKYIIDYICDKYNIALTKKEYQKIQNNLYTHKITYPITDDVYEQLLLSLCGNIDDEKIKSLVGKLELNDIIKNKIDILLELRRRIDNGNSCMKEKYIFNKFNNDEIKIVEQNIKDLILDEYIVIYNEYIYDKKQYDYEINIANKLKDYYNKNSKLKFRIENDISLDELENNNFDFNLKGKIELNDEQKSGILNAWNNPISIITGGPGYGKTTIIKSILQNCYDKFILILAPTGFVVSKIQEDLNAHEK